eukprot:Clim_evm19s217 gene=Clim_evmTU19s217
MALARLAANGLRTFAKSNTVHCAAGVSFVRAMSAHAPPPAAGQRKKVTVNSLKKLYKDDTPIRVMTAYDYPSALWADRAEMDIILVGDSLGMVALGYETTSEVTLDDMVHHCKAVSRGAKNAFLIGDMPFGSFQISEKETMKNAIRLVREGRMEGVKMEGGRHIAPTAEKLVSAGIPVLGHIGLTPQYAAALGGFRVQGRGGAKAAQLLDDALALQDAGCWGLVIECVPDRVAEYITQHINIPTIGIGAGNQTSGQVLVQLDVLGVFDRFVPSFCKQYATVGEDIRQALTQYGEEVRNRSFPSMDHSFSMSDKQFEIMSKRGEEILRSRAEELGEEYVPKNSAPAPAPAEPVADKKPEDAANMAATLAGYSENPVPASNSSRGYATSARKLQTTTTQTFRTDYTDESMG